MYLRLENDQRVILEVTNEEGKWSDDFQRFPKLSCKTGQSFGVQSGADVQRSQKFDREVEGSDGWEPRWFRSL